MSIAFRIMITCGVLGLSPAAASAQNTGGVFGPVVNEDYAAAQYRVTYDPDSEGLAQRVHYEQSLNGDFMLRGVGQVRKTADNDVDFDFVQAELFWELSDDSSSWRNGVRFDARIRSDGRPGLLGAHWMGQWQLSDQLSGRVVVLSSMDVGDDARDGVFLGTRGQLNYATPNGPSIGAELYSSYGSTDRIADFEDQRHQVGPTANINLPHDLSLYANVLFGLTEATPDTELRLWLTRRF